MTSVCARLHTSAANSRSSYQVKEDEDVREQDKLCLSVRSIDKHKDQVRNLLAFFGMGRREGSTLEKCF